jgi:hypothetical protein
MELIMLVIALRNQVLVVPSENTSTKLMMTRETKSGVLKVTFKQVSMTLSRLEPCMLYLTTWKKLGKRPLTKVTKQRTKPSENQDKILLKMLK